MQAINIHGSKLRFQAQMERASKCAKACEGLENPEVVPDILMKAIDMRNTFKEADSTEMERLEAIEAFDLALAQLRTHR